MNWVNWNDLFAMDGYALYVWGAGAVTIIMIALEMLLLTLRRRAIRQHLCLLGGNEP